MSLAFSQIPQDAIADPSFCRRADDMQDIYRLSIDPVSNLIKAFASGCWSLAETDAYISGLAALVRKQRFAFGIARVLLDRRDITVQTDDVAGRLASANGVIFRQDDKIAIVVSSALAKTSLRQRMPHPGSKAFLSIDAAETWLRAFAPAQHVRHQ